MDAIRIHLHVGADPLEFAEQLMGVLETVFGPLGDQLHHDVLEHLVDRHLELAGNRGGDSRTLRISSGSDWLSNGGWPVSSA